MKIKLPEEAKKAVSVVAEKIGKDKVFLVGGFVRDLLLSRHSTDIDRATSLDPDKVFALFPYGYRSPFGTVSFKLGGFSFTIATRRKEEGYLDHRHPSSFVFVGSPLEEYSRRDFTVNCLYVNRDGEILDLTGRGLKDIRHKKLVRIGNPKTRLSEDPLRILRAFRFSKERNLKLSHRLKRARKKAKPLIHNLKKAKIKEEVRKCPKADQKARIDFLSLGFAFEKGE